MPNPIKYTTGTESQALKKGNFYIGTGDVGKGPSDTTGFYQGVSPTSGGYVIYMNKSGAPGELSYHSTANDGELISFTNGLAGESFTTVTQCFNYYYGQTDKVLVSQDYPADYPYIVMDGLVLYLDAGITQSYSGSGTVWTDVNGLGPKNNGTLINGPTFNTTFGGGINQDGSDDYFQITNNSDCLFEGDTSFTIQIIFEKNTFKSNYPALIGCGDQDGTYQGGWHCLYYNDNNFSGPYGQISLGRQTPSSNVTNVGYQFSSVTDSQGVSLFTLMYESGFGSRIYRNTELLSESSLTGSSSQRVAGAPPLYIGRRANISSRVTNNNTFLVQIYNRALSATEVLQNFNATKGRFGL